jgi:hypothetical protein
MKKIIDFFTNSTAFFVPWILAFTLSAPIYFALAQDYTREDIWKKDNPFTDSQGRLTLNVDTGDLGLNTPPSEQDAAFLAHEDSIKGIAQRAMYDFDVQLREWQKMQTELAKAKAEFQRFLDSKGNPVDYYQILQIPPNSSQKAVREAVVRVGNQLTDRALQLRELQNNPNKHRAEVGKLARKVQSALRQKILEERLHEALIHEENRDKSERDLRREIWEQVLRETQNEEFRRVAAQQARQQLNHEISSIDEMSRLFDRAVEGTRNEIVRRRTEAEFRRFLEYYNGGPALNWAQRTVQGNGAFMLGAAALEFFTGVLSGDGAVKRASWHNLTSYEGWLGIFAFSLGADMVSRSFSNKRTGLIGSRKFLSKWDDKKRQIHGSRWGMVFGSITSHFAHKALVSKAGKNLVQDNRELVYWNEQIHQMTNRMGELRGEIDELNNQIKLLELEGYLLDKNLSESTSIQDRIIEDLDYYFNDNPDGEKLFFDILARHEKDFQGNPSAKETYSHYRYYKTVFHAYLVRQKKLLYRQIATLVGQISSIEDSRLKYYRAKRRADLFKIMVQTFTFEEGEFMQLVESSISMVATVIGLHYLEQNVFPSMRKQIGALASRLGVDPERAKAIYRISYVRAIREKFVAWKYRNNWAQVIKGKTSQGPFSTRVMPKASLTRIRVGAFVTGLVRSAAHAMMFLSLNEVIHGAIHHFKNRVPFRYTINQHHLTLPPKLLSYILQEPTDIPDVELMKTALENHTLTPDFVKQKFLDFYEQGAGDKTQYIANYTQVYFGLSEFQGRWEKFRQETILAGIMQNQYLWNNEMDKLYMDFYKKFHILNWLSKESGKLYTPHFILNGRDLEKSARDNSRWHIEEDGVEGGFLKRDEEGKYQNLKNMDRKDLIQNYVIPYVDKNRGQLGKEIRDVLKSYFTHIPESAWNKQIDNIIRFKITDNEARVFIMEFDRKTLKPTNKYHVFDYGKVKRYLENEQKEYVRKRKRKADEVHRSLADKVRHKVFGREKLDEILSQYNPKWWHLDQMVETASASIGWGKHKVLDLPLLDFGSPMTIEESLVAEALSLKKLCTDVFSSYFSDFDNRRLSIVWGTFEACRAYEPEKDLRGSFEELTKGFVKKQQEFLEGKDLDTYLENPGAGQTMAFKISMEYWKEYCEQDGIECPKIGKAQDFRAIQVALGFLKAFTQVANRQLMLQEQASYLLFEQHTQELPVDMFDPYEIMRTQKIMQILQLTSSGDPADRERSEQLLRGFVENELTDEEQQELDSDYYNYLRDMKSTMQEDEWAEYILNQERSNPLFDYSDYPEDLQPQIPDSEKAASPEPEVRVVPTKDPAKTAVEIVSEVPQ